jgi:copper chaperone
MRTLKFKSNIKCAGCIEKVKPVLDHTKGITTWNVDIFTPEKVLTVETESLEPGDIQKAVESAGYKAETLPE